MCPISSDFQPIDAEKAENRRFDGHPARHGTSRHLSIPVGKRNQLKAATTPNSAYGGFVRAAPSGTTMPTVAYRPVLEQGSRMTAATSTDYPGISFWLETA